MAANIGGDKMADGRSREMERSMKTLKDRAKVRAKVGEMGKSPIKLGKNRQKWAKVQART